MKWVKNISLLLSKVVLVNLISILALSYNLKNMIVDGIIKETITSQIINRGYKEENYVISDEDISAITSDERVQEILKSPEIQELMNKYIDITMNSFTNEEELNEIDIERDILEFLKENKETLEEAVGQDITDEMIEKTEQQVEGKDMSRALKQTIQNVNRNMTKEEKTAIKGYQLLISTKFKVLLMILIVINLIGIALLQKSWTEWIKTTGTCLTISGVITMLTCYLFYIMMRKMGAGSFHPTQLLITSIVMFLVGVIISVVYNLVKKGREQNEIS